MEGWREFDRHGQKCWLRIGKPVWVVLYEAIPGYSSMDIYRAYKALHEPKPGQMPWAVDNRSLNKDGFASLASAMAAAEAA